VTAPERTRIEVRIGRRGFLGVETVAGEEDLSGPLFAVNLLDRRRPWAYELYGLLVVRSVLKSGARIVFKGHRRRVLLGDPADARETLLIVRYPAPEAFLNMVRRPYFAAMSLFRRVGLGDFHFGFIRSLVTGPEVPARPRPYTGDNAYLLSTLRGDAAGLAEAGRRPTGEPFFAGRTIAALCARRAGETAARPTRLAPPLGWSAILLHEGLEAELEELARGRLAGLVADAERATCVLYRRKI